MKFLHRYNIIKDDKDLASWLSLLSSTIGIRVIGLIRGLYVARILGPADYGLLSSLLLINSLNKYGSLGFNSVVRREVPFFESQKKTEKVQLIKNVAYSSELSFALLLLIIGLISAYFVSEVRISIAISIASLGLFFGKLAKITRTEIIMEQKFIQLAKLNIYIEILVALLVIGTVHLLGIFSSLIFSIVGSICAIIIFRRTMDYKYQFLIIFDELLRQIKIGIPLVFNTLAYGSYRYSEKLVILYFLGAMELGLFAIAEKISDTLLNLCMIRYKNMSIAISQDLGLKKYGSAHEIFFSNTIFLVFLSVLSVPLVIVISEYSFPLLLGERYGESISVIKVLLFIVPIRVMGGFTSVFLESPLLNKQKILPLFQFLSTVIFVSITTIIYYFGTINIINIVFADIVGYAFWHISLLVLYYKYFFLKFVK